MRSSGVFLLALALTVGASQGWAKVGPVTDTEYHGDSRRTGNLIIPGLTQRSAQTAHLAATFKVTGNVIAQPLYWLPPGRTGGFIIVATDQNVVTALDASTGAMQWQTTLGPPAIANTPQCGPKKSTGITGTPVVDFTTGTIYLDANIQVGSSARHIVYGVSAANGSITPGWPIDVGTALGNLGITFQPDYQGQRSGLTLVNGNLYVSFGGNHGDCGPYHGWVVGLNVASPAVYGAFSTTNQHAGIWSQGGVSSDDNSLYVATGNGMKSTNWLDQNAVFRLGPSLQHSASTLDYYYPSNWATLDQHDLDLDGTSPLPVNVPTSPTAGVHWLLQFGKDGNAYVLNRDNLGGMDGAILVQQVSSTAIIDGPAHYSAVDGVLVAVEGTGTNCPAPMSSTGLVMLKVSDEPAPSISTVWCASLMTNASPLITTSDGHSDPVVWETASQSDKMLHAFAADTGTVLLSGTGVRMNGLQNFTTILAAQNRLFVGAGTSIYVFDYTPGL